MFDSSRFTLIRDLNYRTFWTGQGLSWLGSAMHAVAQGWLVWSLTGSPAQLGLTAAMFSLPVLLFGIAGGATADRFDKRVLLLITQGGSLVPALFLGILTARGEVGVPAIMCLAFCQGTLNAFEAPARQALLAELVPRPRLSQAIAFNSVSFNATRLAGPAAAGCIIAAFGAAPCFFINAFSFVIGMVTLLLVRLPYRDPEHPRRRALAATELLEGVRFVGRQGEVRRLLLSVLLVSLLAIPFVPLLPVFADLFHSGPKGLGLMSASLGSGSLLAAFWLAFGDPLPGRQPSTTAAGMLFPLALLVFSRSADYGLSLVALFVAGAGAALFLAGVNRSLQHASPDRLRGRVMAAYTLTLLGMAPLGSALVGGAAAKLGAPGALTLVSLLCLVGLGFLQLAGASGAFGSHSGAPVRLQRQPCCGGREAAKVLIQRSL